MSERISEQGLASLIHETPYQPTSEDPSHGQPTDSQAGVVGGNDSPTGQIGNEGQSPAVGNVAPPTVQGTGQAGVTNQPASGLTGQSPAFDPRDIQLRQMVETIQNQSRIIQQASQSVEELNRQREDEQFERSIAELTDEEQRAARAERRASMLEAQQRAQAQRQNALNQQQAKSMVAAMTAADFGLPPHASQFLLAASNHSQMQQMAANLRAQGYGQVHNQPAVQQEPQQVQVAQEQTPINPAHLGGDTSPSSDVTPKVEYGSGDLMALIQQTDYQRYSPAE